MQFSFEPKNSSTSQSSRLQKAIERNRAKVAKREAANKTTSRSALLRKNLTRADDIEFTTSARKNSRTATARYSTASTSPRRTRSVATSPIYSEPSPFVKKLKGLVIAIAWGAFFLLLLKLFFASGGVYDFYKRENNLDKRHRHIESILSENNDLHKEIELLKTDAAYQKKVIRDNLGFISKNEYLILFPKEI